MNIDYQRIKGEARDAVGLFANLSGKRQHIFLILLWVLRLIARWIPPIHLKRHNGKRIKKMKNTWGREVTVDAGIWRSATGNGWTGKEPRGKGNWAFHFSGYTYGETPSTDLTIMKQQYQVAKKKTETMCSKGPKFSCCIG